MFPKQTLVCKINAYIKQTKASHFKCHREIPVINNLFGNLDVQMKPIKANKF